MKKRKSFFGAVTTASVLAALLPMVLSTGLLTGCKPKIEPDYGYKVEHWQQNAENDEYAKVEEENLKGKEGKMTSAKAKTYEGFTAQGFSQAAIRADGSTVVRINYNRNIITLKIKFAEDYKTEPKLEAGADGTKLFKGRYGARLLLKNLDNDTLVPIWPQDAPKTFPSSSEDKVYNLTWETGYKIRVKGDRFKPEGSEVLIAGIGKTWSDIKKEVKEKVEAVAFSSDYQGGDYEVYEWRLPDENGPKLNDDYPISGHISVYALTNYVKFNIDSTGTKIILIDNKGYSGAKPKGRIIIPEGITEIEDGRKEDSDYYSAFKDCGELTGVVFPKNLTKIGYGAFSKCTGLKSLDLSGCTKLTAIGEIAFSGCEGLTSVSLSGCTGLTTIGLWAFSGCWRLESISLPVSLTTISNNAFRSTGLKSLDLSGCTKLTEIGRYAFYRCMGLERIELSSCTGLTTIGESAFSGCKGLESINLPANLTTIGKRAVNSGKGLKTLTVDSGNQHYKAVDNVLYTKDGSTLVCAAGGLTSVNILDTVTAIGESAFSDCAGLTSINLSSCTGLTTIGDWAFYGCWDLERIELSSCTGLTTIGKYAFYSCTGLKSINLPASLTTITDHAFDNCWGLESIDLPAGLTQIGGSAFNSCTGLTSINLPAGLTEIGGSAFSDCTGLTSINLPESLTTIGDRAFSGCTGLTSIKLPASLTTIGKWAFYGCPIETLYVNCDIKDSIIENLTQESSVKENLKNLNLGEGVTAIGRVAFYGCKGLESLDLSSCTNLTEIGTSAFYGCTGLTSITLPESLTTIGSGAFDGCKGLESLDLSSCTNLTEIGTYAFYDCKGLESINLPESLTTIGKEAFRDCTKLTSARFADPAGWAVYDKEDYTGGSTSVNLDNESTAAEYLRDTYVWKYWKKN